MLQFISFKAVSAYCVVLSVGIDFDSPAIFLNDTPSLKEVIILSCFVLKLGKLDLDSRKFSFFNSANHAKSLRNSKHRTFRF